jgi:CheY-like chemotaxis protein
MKTVLVIDDDPAIVHLLKEDLSAEGYNVLEGYDGQMALQLARQSKPDLIVMDVNMPLINGVKALEYLRGLEDTCLIPILFLTGEATGNLPQELLDAPRAAHLKKPIDLEHLNSMIRQFIAKYPVRT